MILDKLITYITRIKKRGKYYFYGRNQLINLRSFKIVGSCADLVKQIKKPLHGKWLLGPKSEKLVFT